MRARGERAEPACRRGSALVWTQRRRCRRRGHRNLGSLTGSRPALGSPCRTESLRLQGAERVFRDMQRSAPGSGADGPAPAPHMRPPHAPPPASARPAPSRPPGLSVQRGFRRRPCTAAAFPPAPHHLPEPALVPCSPRALPPDRTEAAATRVLEGYSPAPLQTLRNRCRASRQLASEDARAPRLRAGARCAGRGHAWGRGRWRPRPEL